MSLLQVASDLGGKAEPLRVDRCDDLLRRAIAAAERETDKGSDLKSKALASLREALAYRRRVERTE